MWNTILNWTMWIAISAAIGVILMAIVYVASGVQAKAWMDVFEKYFKDKLKK